MGHIQVPGTSVVYDDPRQVDQSTLIDSQTGKIWGIQPLGGGTLSNGVALAFPAPWSPQPGSFDATPPQANPVLFNKQSASLSEGGIKIPNSTCTVKNPA